MKRGPDPKRDRTDMNGLKRKISLPFPHRAVDGLEPILRRRTGKLEKNN